MRKIGLVTIKPSQVLYSFYLRLPAVIENISGWSPMMSLDWLWEILRQTTTGSFSKDPYLFGQWSSSNLWPNSSHYSSRVFMILTTAFRHCCMSKKRLLAVLQMHKNIFISVSLNKMIILRKSLFTETSMKKLLNIFGNICICFLSES